MNSLDDIMSIDHVIRILPGGIIDDNVPGVWSPEVHIDTDDDGQILDAHEKTMIEELRAQGWEPLNGWSGQYSYSGPIMHASEYIGGGLEKHIRETPGFYVAVAVETDDADDPAGWLCLYRETVWATS